MKNYYPILVSKNGEIGALQHLEQHVKDEICPIIEVINSTLIKFKTDKATGVETMSYSDKFERFLRTHWNFFNNQIILDFSLFVEWDNHIDFLRDTLIRLLNSGVNIIPSVQTNSTQSYKNLIRELVGNYNCNLCFRFSNSSGGFVHMDNDIANLIGEFRIELNNLIILTDLGQIDSGNYNTIGSSAGVVLQNLNYDLNQFESVILASSSFPAGLGGFESSEEAHTIVRYEWSLFNNIARGNLDMIKYGDYGTKTAIFEDVNYMGSISLKYSTSQEYVIYRGLRTVDHHLGHKQFISHSRKLIDSAYFSGNAFSWGDLRYFEISQQDLQNGSPGNSMQWVQFSQNHHITLMHSIL
ncbi:hypothetical protein [uncultured Psychroserpens sp.]|uniref:beta family protein n=1 Tax=uncultured Psychroserpens sp. TaxID=255436 RepID=UPI0026057689|nr:hypothetical protein [uncultured Psychroserpens sp.]